MYKQYLYFAKNLAEKAGQFIRLYAGKAGKVTLKSDKDFVTEMDLQVESFIIHHIKEQYPDHRIFSEEAGFVGGSGDFEWIIDPIDGTVNYSVGMPLYGVSIALTYKGDTVVAAISLPALEELFWAAKGEGAFQDGKQIKVRTTALSESFVSLGDFSKEGDRESNKERLILMDNIVNDVFRIRIIGTAAATLAYIAAGRLDAAIYLNPKRYDIAAGQLLVAEAGGIQRSAGEFEVFSNNKLSYELTNLIQEPK
ncbi:myo-inositol-1(or 4)-monophosphatase [Scopulibacillus darangshiensis]|uniref:inositol-phosphate phosphatase n=1 Tax=Scopulibacillus darangshiensis TaxID=442528 RepID=A0A4V2SML7_9BACL|nr:inositol monophosphatase [Scopulibacillus darangshiensis]TCP27796.1 myo-inositol-1(or 4)-monophosphatase [Scopulibacillus darangshiensis]